MTKNTKKTQRFTIQQGKIYDNLTGKYYHKLPTIKVLLNKLNEKNNKLIEKYYTYK